MSRSEIELGLVPQWIPSRLLISIGAFGLSPIWAQEACPPLGCGSWDPPLSNWTQKPCNSDVESGCDSTCTGLGVPWRELVHAVLVLVNPTSSSPSWRVMMMDLSHPGTAHQKWFLWDPASPTTLTEGDPLANVGLFCSSHSVLEDGTVHVAGGQKWPAFGGPADCSVFGPPWARIYDPTPTPTSPNGTWTAVPDMASGRYYPTSTGTPEGTVMVMAGDAPGTFEVFDAATGAWSGPFTYSTIPGCPVVYPQAHLLPAVNAGSRGAIHVSSPYDYDTGNPYVGCPIVDPMTGLIIGQNAVPTQLLHLPLLPGSFAGSWIQGPAPASTPEDRTDAISVLVVDCTPTIPVSDLFVGTGRPSPFVPGAPAYASIRKYTDVQRPGTTRTDLPSLNLARYEASAVLLPGRKLLILGGEEPSGFFDLRHPELLDLVAPASGWQLMNPHDQDKIYHSFALLLPDGRVLLAGGRRPAGVSAADYVHAQVFSPPYLFQGPRPVVRAAPSSGIYGGTIQVQLHTVPPSGISSFELARPASTTHSTDFDQRLVVLGFSDLGGGSFTVSMPPGPDCAPPGWYMLFAVAGDGAPSVAKYLHLP